IGMNFIYILFFFFFSSRRRHTRFDCDWSSDVCSSDLMTRPPARKAAIGEDPIAATRVTGSGKGPMTATAMTLVEHHTWLPAGKRAAVCFSVDDVHPATSRDEFDAGGDLGRGALGRLERLLERNPSVRVTLFVTPD